MVWWAVLLSPAARLCREKRRVYVIAAYFRGRRCVGTAPSVVASKTGWRRSKRPPSRRVFGKTAAVKCAKYSCSAVPVCVVCSQFVHMFHSVDFLWYPPAFLRGIHSSTAREFVFPDCQIRFLCSSKGRCVCGGGALLFCRHA